MTQGSFTLIEMIIVTAMIGILVSIATVSYQTQVRKMQVMTIYKEISHFRLPYQILLNEGAGVSGFSPYGLNIPAQTKYCQFTVTVPNANAATPNAVSCQIQNLSYLTNETLTWIERLMVVGAVELLQVFQRSIYLKRASKI